MTMSFANFKFCLNSKQMHLNDIKRFLICRDLSKQICGVEILLSSLNSTPQRKELTEKLINADIVELLCETLCTTNTILLQLAFKCFSKLIECDTFFDQHHTVYTFESLLRTLHVLDRTDDNRETLVYGLQLVCKIISRLKSLGNIVLIDVCDVPNIINLIIFLSKNEENHKVIYAANVLLLNILCSGDIISLKETVMEAVLISLKRISNFVREDPNKTFVALIAELVNGSMSFFAQPEIRPNDQQDEEIFIQLQSTLKDILVPYLIETDSCHSDFDLIQVILCSFLSVYHFPKKKITEEFSNILAHEGFLGFLPIIENQVDEAELVLVVRSLIFELLACLSHYYLGEDNWKQLLLPGLEALPVGMTYNSILLRGSDVIIPVASVVYNYFYLLSLPSPNVDVDFLKDLSRYVMLIVEKPTTSFMKALWFNFSVAYLCNSEKFQQSRIALMKLVSLIMTFNIHSVYTHHPAILYWAFCDHAVTSELQTEIIMLWIEKEDDKSISEIKSLLKINKDSFLLTMEVMAACENKTSQNINNILSTVLPECENNGELYEHAWLILPTHLAKYSSNPEESRYDGLAYLMKYCCDYIPETLEQSLIMRISCLLPGVFSKYHKIAYRYHIVETLILSEHEACIAINTFNFVSVLLLIGINKNDKRVSAAFLAHEAFLNTIEFFLSADNGNLLSVVMHLLMCFILSQKKTRQKCSKNIPVHGTTILQFLQGEAKLCIAVLKLLASYFEILSDKLETCIISIPQPSGILLRSLYLHIHMICAKSDDVTASLCWLCLRKLLEFSESMGLKEHLATLPYTPTLLLKTTGPEAWKEATTFLSIWLKIIPHNSSKALSPLLSLEVFQQLTAKLSKSADGKQLVHAMNKILQ